MVAAWSPALVELLAFKNTISRDLRWRLTPPPSSNELTTECFSSGCCRNVTSLPTSEVWYTEPLLKVFSPRLSLCDTHHALLQWNTGWNVLCEQPGGSRGQEKVPAGLLHDMRARKQASSILSDPHHSAHFPSGRRFCSISTRTSRHLTAFFRRP